MLVVLAGIIGACSVVAFIVLAYRRGWQWTGLPADAGDEAEPPRPAKTLWDWLQLLIIPLVLAFGAFVLNTTQASRDRNREDRQAARDRAIADDRAQEDTLRAYLQQMSDLITDHRLRPRPDSGPATRTDVDQLARTLTLTTLRRVNPERKALVVRFLADARLITAPVVWLRTSGGALRRLDHKFDYVGR